MIYNLLSELQAKGEVDLIALSLNEGILSEKLRQRNVPTEVIPESGSSFLGVFIRALLFLRGRKIDLIHSHRYKENLLALFLAKATGVKRLVTTLHGLPEAPHAGYPQDRLGAKTRLDHRILKRNFTRVVAVSQEMKETLVHRYRFSEDRLAVIYNGIPLPASSEGRSGLDRAGIHIGTVGRMVPVKDFDLFLRVAAEVLKKDDRVRFSILGDGPLRGKLIQTAKELKIDPFVHFLSPRPDPSDFYRSLDLYLNTSLHEGIPISVLEAMACGKPVVASAVGGIPEILSHGRAGMLIDGRDPEGFARSCLRLIEDERLRDSMGEEARRRVASDFSGSKMAGHYSGLYLDLSRLTKESAR